MAVSKRKKGQKAIFSGKYSQSRIEYLDDLGLIVVVYRAWGHQLDWLGREKMAK
jgi:hypothetical protein